MDELRELVSREPLPESLLMGTTKWLRHFVAVRPTQKRQELGNLLVVAPTRSGKGLLAISQLLTWGSSVLVNDIKGELFTATAGYRSSLGKVFVIDPTGIGNCFDPLYAKQTEDALFSAASQMLFSAEEREPIFTQRATVMLTQLFLAAKQEGIPAFLYVRQLSRLGLSEVAGRLHTLSPALATQFLDVRYEEANVSDRFLLSAWGTLTAKIRPLLSETLIRSLIRSDFTAQDLMCGPQPVTVYFRWKEEDLLAGTRPGDQGQHGNSGVFTANRSLNRPVFRTADGQ
jgi:type IV secretion system protein VirD4